MANAMNMIQLTIIGRVVADPEVKTVNNKEVTKFRVIYNSEVNGEKKTMTFHCSAYNGLNRIAQFLKKGRLVCVTSNDFTQAAWSRDNKVGVNNYLLVNSITILDKKPVNNSDQDWNLEEVPF
ncbi:MAG: single-stranded DNA-binding protein [Sporomusaceae bacterium]|jgi:single-stranded DNA-binding protein|nr:single-stranded DNA-binding protein [Sporomusaceae bacterium]